MNYVLKFGLYFFLLLNQCACLCIGLAQSKHIGKGVSPLSQEAIIHLSGLLSDFEKENLIYYFKTNQKESEFQTIIALLENNNDAQAIKWCIDHNINLASILNISVLRHTMIYSGKHFNPWFLKEVALLPVVCGCLKNCIIDTTICRNITYLLFLIDQIERNHHRIETENDHQMLTDALIIINNQLESLHPKSSKLHKKMIAQGIEKLFLIEKMHTLNYSKNRKGS